MAKREGRGAFLDGVGPLVVGCLFLFWALACGGGSPRGAVSAPPAGVITGPVDQSRSPLSVREELNALAFVRLQGLVRHFHPSDGVEGADWQVLSVEGMRLALNAGDLTALKLALEAAFQPVAPTVQVFEAGAAPPLPQGLREPGGPSVEWVHWRHEGWGFNGVNPNPYTSTRRRLPLNQPLPATWDPPDQPLEVELVPGLWARVPLTLYAVGGATLPAPTRALPYSPYGSTTVMDRPTRLAAIGMAWNLWQHHFPYFDQLEVDWAAQLPPILGEAAVAPDAPAFARALRHLLHALKDGHGHCSFPGDPDQFRPNLVLDWVEGQWAVARFPGQPLEGLRLGDVVLRVDGQDIQDLWADFEARQTGSIGWVRDKGRRELLAGPWGSSVRLEVRHSDGSMAVVSLPRDTSLGQFNGASPEVRGDVVRELAPGILYVDLNRLERADYQANLPKLQAAKGLVCDMRGYVAAGAYALMANLLDRSIPGIRLSVPVAERPDRKALQSRDSAWSMAPAGPRLAAKVAFITDGRAISQAESFLGFVEVLKARYPLVGAPSAGADGNVSGMLLPGGFTVAFTGMTVLKPDGSQLFLNGYTPTHPASRTLKGLAEGRDELLETALALVR